MFFSFLLLFLSFSLFYFIYPDQQQSDKRFLNRFEEREARRPCSVFNDSLNMLVFQYGAKCFRIEHVTHMEHIVKKSSCWDRFEIISRTTPPPPPIPPKKSDDRQCWKMTAKKKKKKKKKKVRLSNMEYFGVCISCVPKVWSQVR